MDPILKSTTKNENGTHFEEDQTNSSKFLTLPETSQTIAFYLNMEITKICASISVLADLFLFILIDSSLM